MIAATALFVGSEAIGKLLSVHYATVQVVWGRFFFHALFLALILGARLPAHLHTTRLGLQLVRSALLVGANYFFFAALRTMALVDANVIMFLAPIFTTALAIPLLAERVGAWRWAGVVGGFAGALVMIRPGVDGVQPAALLALGAAAFYAAYQIVTRRLSSYDSSVTTLCYTVVVGVAATSLIVPFAWTPPDAAGWLGMAAMGAIGGLGHFCLIRAFAHAPASVVSPFGYAGLVWSTLLGFAIFGDLPDRWTLAGAILIVGSGLYVLHHERAPAKFVDTKS
jgi:drug/metabolite transporter (DMT)-like permease